MRRPAAILLVLTALAVPGVATADTLMFQPPVANMDNLDHHYIYTWRIDGVTQMAGLTAGNANHVVTGARLYIDDISNWDNTANRLFVHLLDDAKQNSNYLRAGGGNNALYRNVDTTGQPVTDIDDDFSNTHAYGEDGMVLVANGTPSTTLGDKTSTTQYNSAGGTSSWLQGKNAKDAGKASTMSFTTTEEDYTYHFTEAQIASLVDYIRNGNDFALALDPDCHFENDYIKLYIDFGAAQQVVPEPASMLLLGTGLAGLVARRNRRSRR